MSIPLIRALRPQQWVKNSFVLAPLVFAHRMTDLATLERAGLAFVAFCAISSAVYLINDVRDRELDRHHPRKKFRPIAAGLVSPRLAVITSVLLAVFAIGLGFWLAPATAGFITFYLVLNLLYSMGLKQVVILDVMSISLGFVLRVLGGAEAIDVQVSNWIILCTVFVALFLAFSKRRHELTLLADSAVEQRAVLGNYSPIFLDQMMSVVSTSTVLAYSLYAISPETAERFNTQLLVYTVPLVLYGIFRYLYLTYQQQTDRNPTEEILSDKPFLINGLLWAVIVILIVYKS